MDSTPTRCRCAKPHGHDPFHRTINAFPTGLENLRRLPPTQSSRPASQKTHHGRCQRMLAFIPGNMLHHHAVLGTFHPPRRIAKIHPNPPQRNMTPTALGQLVITRRGLLASRTAPCHAGVRSSSDLNPLRPARLAVKPYVLEDESGMGLNLIQNRFNVQLNGWSPRRGFLCCSNHRLTPPTETSFLSAAPCAAPSCGSSACRLPLAVHCRRKLPTNCAIEPR